MRIWMRNSQDTVRGSCKKDSHSTISLSKKLCFGSTRKWRCLVPWSIYIMTKKLQLRWLSQGWSQVISRNEAISKACLWCFMSLALRFALYRYLNFWAIVNRSKIEPYMARFLSDLNRSKLIIPETLTIMQSIKFWTISVLVLDARKERP